MTQQLLTDLSNLSHYLILLFVEKARLKNFFVLKIPQYFIHNNPALFTITLTIVQLELHAIQRQNWVWYRMSSLETRALQLLEKHCIGCFSSFEVKLQCLESLLLVYRERDRTRFCKHIVNVF